MDGTMSIPLKNKVLCVKENAGTAPYESMIVEHSCLTKSGSAVLCLIQYKEKKEQIPSCI